MPPRTPDVFGVSKLAVSCRVVAELSGFDEGGSL